jgi:hypothetical protein
VRFIIFNKKMLEQTMKIYTKRGAIFIILITLLLLLPVFYKSSVFTPEFKIQMTGMAGNGAPFPVAYQGVNPIDNYNSTSSSVTFDMNCYSNVSVHTIQLWTNTAGTWQANYTNSSYANDTWLNTTVSGINEGNYVWAVWCNDTSGLMNITANRTVSVDATYPLVSYDDSTDNSSIYTKTWVFINVTASDTHKDTVKLYWNGSAENFQNQSGNIYWSNKTNLTDYNYTFYAWVNDTAGNANQTTARWAKIDTTAPLINPVGPSGTIYSTGTTLTATTNENSVCRYSATDVAYENMTGNFTGSTTTHTASISPGYGSYTYYVRCNDTAGNVNITSAVISFTLAQETSPPSGGGGGGGGTTTNITTNRTNQTQGNATQRICLPGEQYCTGNVMQTCNTTGTDWYPTLCEYGCDSTTFKCRTSSAPEGGCTTGSKRCSGNELQECDGTTWNTVQTCEYGCDETNFTCGEKPVEGRPLDVGIIIIVSLVIMAVLITVLIFLKKIPL